MSTTQSTPPNPDDGQSRLDRELEEILRRSESTAPLPKPPRPRPTPLRSVTNRTSPLEMIPTPFLRFLRVPIAQAFVLAILAAIVQEWSPLLATLLCGGVIVCIMVPIIAAFRRPSPTSNQKMWRGRVVDISPDPGPAPTFDSIRNWWRNRR